MSQFPYEKAAIILAESELYGDKRVAERWGITDRTIRNYRTRAAEDPQLSSLFQLKIQLLEREWTADATKALKVSLDKLVELVRSDGKPEQIHAVAGAIKIVGELKIASDVLSEPAPYQSSQRT